ncbi:alginate export family protein [Sphingomonas piscis]|uniref:Alginate export family protein n=2 Tax=Sphingomonas piscis TaxID=2714943 RepID=A0A6G7YTC4_9SPHN|nr:alginate export family protein [Sphingomonas piscis]
MIAAAATSAMATPAFAEATAVTPLLDLRVRHEFVDQDGFADEANATTLRARGGAEASMGAWRLLGEAEATVPLNHDYDSGFNGKAGYPLVSDPKNLELNRLQLQYRGLARTVVTGGRQRILIEDQRFVGNSGWRQNEQTFDAVRLEYADPKGLKADLTYSWSVRTIWGRDGVGGRQQAVDGNYLFANLGHPTPIGNVSAFAVLIDQNEQVVSLYRQSSKTLGIRVAGAKPLSKAAKLTYAFSFASQADYQRNPNDYVSNYLLTEAGVESGPWKLVLGREVLGADKGVAFTSFQTPLATLHKFNGWADKFLTAPPNGLRDLYASVAYGWKKQFGFDSIGPAVTYHRYRSDRLGQHYGNEWNAIIAAKKGRWTVTAKYAGYDARQFATDTEKAWLQVEWAY